MNEEMMTTGSTPGAAGFSGNAAPTGPVAGFDPKLAFKKKLQKRKKMKEEIDRPIEVNRVTPYGRSKLFQYKVSIPGVGDTVVYANSPAELSQKMRLLINPRYRGDVKIERIMPAKAAEFFMNKRMAHMKNVDTAAVANKRLYAHYGEELEPKFKQAQSQRKIAIEKKKIQLKKQQLQKQLQMKTQSLKKQARSGAEQDETR